MALEHGASGVDLGPQAAAPEPRRMSPRGVSDPEVHEHKRLFLKTKLCKFWAVGACSRSAGCKFAHGRQDLRRLPDFTKTRLCPAVLAGGACAAGEACSYAHSLEELRPCVGEAVPQAAATAASVVVAPLARALHAGEAASEEQDLWGHTGGDGDDLEDQLAVLMRMRTQLREAACSLALFQDALLQASTGACDGGSLGTTPSGGPSRQTTAGPAAAGDPAPGSEGARTTPSGGSLGTTPSGGPSRQTTAGPAAAGDPAPGSEGGSEAGDDPPWRLEVKNTFLTVADDEIASPGRPLRNVQSSPCLLQRH